MAASDLEMISGGAIRITFDPMALTRKPLLKSFILMSEAGPEVSSTSVRDLAREAQVNPNTMMRALSELENRELIISHRVNGKSVTEDTKLIKKVKDELAKNVIKDFLDGMMQLGYTKEEILELL